MENYENYSVQSFQVVSKCCCERSDIFNAIIKLSELWSENKINSSEVGGWWGGHAMRKSFTFIVDSFLCFCHTFPLSLSCTCTLSGIILKSPDSIFRLSREC